MAADDKDRVAPEVHEIPVEGPDGATCGAACCGSAPEAEDAAVDAAAQDAEAAADGAVDADAAAADEAVAEAEAVVAEAAKAVEAEQAAGDVADQAADQDELAVAKAEAAAMRDKYLRLQADWDNFRKRTAEQADDQRRRATERLMGDILPVLDDFERAIAHAEGNGETGLLDGVKAISNKLGGVLGKHGLEAIDPAGEAFDALEHQAVGQVEDPAVFDETVAQVYQKGYRLGTKVIRPAMVTVSTGGPQRPSENEEESK